MILKSYLVVPVKHFITCDLHNACFKLLCDSTLTENTHHPLSLHLRNTVTDLRGAGGTGGWGANGTFLNEVESWWDRGKAEMLDTLVSSMGFPVLADR